MARFVVRRTLQALVVLFLVSIFTFLIFQVIPNGNPAERLAGRTATPAEVADIARAWGFNRPVVVQYATMMEKIFSGTVVSYSQQVNVLSEIKRGLPATISLAVGASVIWLTLGTALGLLSALKPGGAGDRILAFAALTIISAPVFVIGAMALYLFAYRTSILPSGGYVSFVESPYEWFMHMLLPWICLALPFIGFYSRVLRANVLDTMNEDFVRMARAKGLSRSRVLTAHVLRTSMIPVVALWGLDFAGVIGGGAILVESIFDLQGVGQYAAQSIQTLDVPPIMVIVMYTAVLVVVVGAVVDVLYAFLDSVDPTYRLMSHLLEVQGLSVSYVTEDGVVRAVDDVSFFVDSGEVLCLVGESGSGKSVTCMTLMGLTRAPNARFRGGAIFRGTDLLQATERTLQKIRGNDIALIPQDPMSALNPVQRIGDQIVEQIRAHDRVSESAARDRMVELLTRVGIPRAKVRSRSFVHEFSGGMRQRVMIAMALSCSPQLIVADEPTTALDVTVQAQILSELAELCKETGASLLLVTHDFGVVAEMADRVVVMYGGRVVEEAPVTELFEDPQHPYTWGLLGSVPRADRPRAERLPMIAGSAPSPLRPPPGCHFSPRCPHQFPRCAEVPPLVDRVPGRPEHRDRCWLELADKRRLRMVDGAVGLATPEGAGSSLA